MLQDEKDKVWSKKKKKKVHMLKELQGFSQLYEEKWMLHVWKLILRTVAKDDRNNVRFEV